ncbi:hypothetical protein CsSME_00002143 [Camellia sinensis var. sinensis]
MEKTEQWQQEEEVEETEEEEEEEEEEEKVDAVALQGRRPRRLTTTTAIEVSDASKIDLMLPSSEPANADGGEFQEQDTNHVVELVLDSPERSKKSVYSDKVQGTYTYMYSIHIYIYIYIDSLPLTLLCHRLFFLFFLVFSFTERVLGNNNNNISNMARTIKMF